MPLETLKIRPNILMCYNYLMKSTINVLGCKLDTRIPNEFWPFLTVGKRHKISPCIKAASHDGQKLVITTSKQPTT